MDPDNVLLGDVSPTDLPKAEINREELIEEKKMAKYSKTAEFKRIQDHFEERIKFYQTYLPDGRPVATIPKEDLEGAWVIANTIIVELRMVIDMYENAKDAVDNAEKNA